MKIKVLLLCACSIFISSKTVWAQAELRDIPGSFSIATRMAKNCIFEQQLQRPSTLLSEPIAIVKSQPNATKSLGVELGAALVIKLIDFGLGKLDTYIDNAAKDRVARYSRRHPTSLHKLKKVDDAYFVSVNPDLGCLTIVASTSPITYTGKPHSDVDKAQIASFKTLLKNGFDFEPTSSPSFIFETAIFFSQDGSAARLVPTFLKVVSFDNGKGDAVIKAARQVALTYSLEKVGGTTPIFRDTIDLGLLSVNKAVFSINGSDKRNYYDQKLLETHLPQPAWKALSSVDFEVDPKKNPLVDAINKGFLEAPLISTTPVNFTIDITVTEEASEVAKFLSDFAQEQELTSILREKFIDELGLRSEEEINEALTNEYTARKTLVETYRDAYVARYAESDDKPEDYSDNLLKYEAEIQRLDLLLLELQGVDPLGIFTSLD